MRTGVCPVGCAATSSVLPKERPSSQMKRGFFGQRTDARPRGAAGVGQIRSRRCSDGNHPGRGAAEGVPMPGATPGPPDPVECFVGGTIAGCRQSGVADPAALAVQDENRSVEGTVNGALGLHRPIHAKGSGIFLDGREDRTRLAHVLPWPYGCPAAPVVDVRSSVVVETAAGSQSTTRAPAHVLRARIPMDVRHRHQQRNVMHRLQAVSTVGKIRHRCQPQGSAAARRKDLVQRRYRQRDVRHFGPKMPVSPERRWAAMRPTAG